MSVLSGRGRQVLVEEGVGAGLGGVPAEHVGSRVAGEGMPGPGIDVLLEVDPARLPYGFATAVRRR
jgi:hypothetical protein